MSKSVETGKAQNDQTFSALSRKRHLSKCHRDIILGVLVTRQCGHVSRVEFRTLTPFSDSRRPVLSRSGPS
jgi:hypothetical protein